MTLAIWLAIEVKRKFSLNFPLTPFLGLSVYAVKVGKFSALASLLNNQPKLGEGQEWGWWERAGPETQGFHIPL